MRDAPSTVNTKRVSRQTFFKLIWQFIQIAPIPLCLTIFLRLINAVSRGFQPVVIAGFTNALINAEDLFFWGGVYLVLTSFELLTDAFNASTQTWFSNKAILHFQQHLLRLSAETPFLHFLDSDFHDNLNRATHNFSERVVNWFESTMGNVHSLATVCGLLSAVLIIGGGMECVIILFVSSLIIFLTRIPVARLELMRDRAAARPLRTLDVWAKHLYQRASAPEIRLFTLPEWLLSKWTDAYRKLAMLEINVLKRKTAWNALAGLASILGYGAIIFIAAAAAQNADETEVAGVFTGLITAAVTLQGILSAIAYGIGNLTEQSSVLRDLAPLFTMQPAKEESACHTKHQDRTASDPDTRIEMNALSFQYPRSSLWTLKHITEKIKYGEIVAIVGKNGAGKTTLANLLLGLYAPDRGTLKFSENRGASHVPTRSAVFQNFVKYLLPVRDNVGFADINRIQDDAHMQNTLHKAGSIFAHELDAWLGHEFGGRDISGGEWLRIAVARGLFRNSNLVVFDEPTASIDPVAEVEIIRELLTKDEKRTTLVISHRLGVARLCDRILVLDEGKLVEIGTHETLLAEDGLYAKMWNAQASWYTEIQQGN